MLRLFGPRRCRGMKNRQGENSPMAEILNIRQVAKKIGKSPRTVWRWVKKGWLPAPLYPNGWPVWDAEEVERRLSGR